MYEHRSVKRFKRIGAILMATFMAAIAATVVFATGYVICTFDIDEDTSTGYIGEWSSQGLAPIHFSDQSGSVDPNLDIKDVCYVMGENVPLEPTTVVTDHHFFLLQTYGSEPLLPEDTAIAAIFDCNGDSDYDDLDDRIIVYIRNGSGGFTGYPDDALFVVNGSNYSNYGTPGDSVEENHAMGQPSDGIERPNGYIEWSAPVSSLGLGDPEYVCGDTNRGSAQISFMTAKLDIQFGFPSTPIIEEIYDQTEFTSLPDPTVLTLGRLDTVARPFPRTILALVTVGLAFSTAAVTLQLSKREDSKP